MLRFARHIALPEVGGDGQGRIERATFVVAGDAPVADTAALYLAAAGAAAVRRITPTDWPADGPAWLEALRGATVAVRAGFDDDAMLRAAVRLGVPLVAARGRDEAVEVIAFRRHGPCPHQALDVPPRRGEPSTAGPAAVAAGAMAAAEALLLAVDGPLRAAAARARHVVLSLAPGAEARAADLPWAPECFACGGHGREAVMP